MKKHAIIPIFIPHQGCPNDCVFCNQKAITARDQAPSLPQIRQRIDAHLETLSGRALETVEIAFFGGSFTGIPLEQQTAYLEVAQEYKEKGLVDKLHLSTRPDYIDERILDNLKAHGVDVIELGVQSFDDEVLKQSNRGHGGEIVYKSSRLVKEYGFELGIQLMIGLPGDSYESCLFSAGETVKLQPQVARLYPTVILADTQLYRMAHRGEYVARPEAETLRITKDMYRTLQQAGIYILRVGLKSTDIIRSESDAVCGDYHPAFRQLVEGELAREDMEQRLCQMLGQGARELANHQIPEEQSGSRGEPVPYVREGCRWDPADKLKVTFSAKGESFSNMIGNKRRNARYFEEKYPHIQFRFCRDDQLGQGYYNCKMEGDNTYGKHRK